MEASAGEAANGITNITVVGSQLTVYLDDGTALGPYTLPTAMIRYRGDWTAATALNEMDLVTVPETGIYLVLQDHTSAAAFDANARDADNNQLYRFLFPMGTGSLGELSDVDLASEAPTDDEALVYSGGTWFPGLPTMGLGDLQQVFPGTPTDGDVLTWVAADVAWRSRAVPAGSDVSVSDEGVQILAAPADINFAGAGVAVTDNDNRTVTVTIDGGGGGASALDDLSDVALVAPAAADYLRFDGTAWVDSPLAWADLSDKPATFPPSAHTHPSTEISDFAEAVDDRVAALLVAGANITLTYDDVANTFMVAAAGGPAASVSDEGTLVLASPTDLNSAEIAGTSRRRAWSQRAGSPAARRAVLSRPLPPALRSWSTARNSRREQPMSWRCCRKRPPLRRC